MMKIFQVFLGIIAILVVFISGIGCSGGTDVVAEREQIPSSARTITFNGGLADDGTFWGPVEFTHEKHSTEYYNELCIACHDHQAVSGETQWFCSDCHSAGEDREDLCDEPDDHGCTMTQCQNCHELEGPPAPAGGDTCTDCHS